MSTAQLASSSMPCAAPRSKPSRPAGADTFLAELERIRSEVSESVPAEPELRLLRRQVRVGRLCSLAGYACAWLAPNPLAMLLLSLGRFTRWVTVAHTTLHGAYDRLPGAASHETSRGFAQGRRRWIDWLDVIEPNAWHTEHNIGHHCYLGDERDPDRVFSNMAFTARLHPVARWALALGLALTWKWTYYAPKVLQYYRSSLRKRRTRGPSSARVRDTLAFALLRAVGPYALVHFVAVPLLFSVLGFWAAFSVLVNSLGAELLTNLHSFLVIVPNHTAADLPAFSEPASDRHEHVLRQIVGSVNYQVGTPSSDFLTGFIGYQIEHHLWPSMTPLQYRAAQPRVEQLCKEHGIPYRREPLARRIAAMFRVLVGVDQVSSVPSARSLVSRALVKKG
jgi:fatty acid desaturase